MKKRCMKIIGWVCFLCLVASVIFTFCKIDVFERATEDDFYFNFITISSVIAGFAFTNIGLLLSVAGTDIVKRLSTTDIMQKKNDKLTASVIYCVVAMILSLLYVIDLGEIASLIIPLDVIEVVADGLYLAIIILLVVGIVYFIKSMLELSTLLEQIYKKKSKLSDEDKEAYNEAYGKCKGK